MDIHHKNPRFVGDDRKPVVQAGLDIDGSTANHYSKVVMKRVFARPLGACLGYFIDFPACRYMLEHQATNVFQGYFSQFPS